MDYNDSDRQILNRIVDRLEAMGLSNKDLCDYLGIKSSAVTSWKNGQSSSYLKKLPSIADFFGVSVDYLVSGEQITSEEDELLEELKNRPDLKVLFSVAKDASAEDIYKAIGMLSVMREHRNG